MLSIVFLCIYAYLNAVSNFLNHIRLFLVNGILASFAISSISIQSHRRHPSCPTDQI